MSDTNACSRERRTLGVLESFEQDELPVQANEHRNSLDKVGQKFRYHSQPLHFRDVETQAQEGQSYPLEAHNDHTKNIMLSIERQDQVASLSPSIGCNLQPSIADEHTLDHTDFNGKNQPIGLNAKKLTRYLGMLVRDGTKLPIDYTDWRGVPHERKEHIWNLVLVIFNLKVNPIIGKEYVFGSMNKQWRNYKSKLKRDYVDVCTSKDDLPICPDGVDPIQWEHFVAFWDTEGGKVRVETNKHYSRKLMTHHTAGSKSFAQIYEEEKAKRPAQQEISRADMFIITRTRKNGQAVNEKVSEKECLKELVGERSEDQTDEPTPIDIFSQVYGKDKPGYIRTFGQGVKPRDYWGPSSSRLQILNMLDEEKASRIVAEEKNIELHDKLVAMKSSIEKLTSSVNMLISNQHSSSSEPSNLDVSFMQLLQGHGYEED